MAAVLVSTKGQVVLPVSVRKALGLKPGMRVNIEVEGKAAGITPAPAKAATTLEEVQAILRYSGPRIPIDKMRVTSYEVIAAALTMMPRWRTPSSESGMPCSLRRRTWN